MADDKVNIVEDMDINKFLEVAEELANKKDLEMPYGSLLFWIAIIKRVEKLPEDISLKDFYKFLGDNYSRKATVSAKEI
jgi:hypothetical protein